MISTVELAVRLLVYGCVLVGVSLFLVVMFRLMDYAQYESLVDQL